MKYNNINYRQMSQGRDHINRSQQRRCSKLDRIDYANVSIEAKEIIDSLRSNAIGGDASSILNRIVMEWSRQKEMESGII